MQDWNEIEELKQQWVYVSVCFQLWHFIEDYKHNYVGEWFIC